MRNSPLTRDAPVIFSHGVIRLHYHLCTFCPTHRLRISAPSTGSEPTASPTISSHAHVARCLCRRSWRSKASSACHSLQPICFSNAGAATSFFRTRFWSGLSSRTPPFSASFSLYPMFGEVGKVKASRPWNVEELSTYDGSDRARVCWG